MSVKEGISGLIFSESLLWEKGKKGRSAFSIPKRDVEEFEFEEGLKGNVPNLPELSELDVVRHYVRLSQWNFGVDTGMYPLGSCTMKYNPKINDKLASIEGFSHAHPLLPEEFAQGSLEFMYKLSQCLIEITKLDAVTLQPAAGAHGELLGMLIISAFHKSRGEKRDKLIIPDTAHGTNPASAALCGYKPVQARSHEKGILDKNLIAELMDDETAGILITNPNTLGLYEEDISEISDIVHAKGGLVYGDGANLNAIMGIVDIGETGIDILHLNLHKTFSTPHGGGGPGAGPVCVKKHLEPFLPVPRVLYKGDKYYLDYDSPSSIGKLHAFYGNFGVLIKAYAYILSLGSENIKRVSELSVLNANYIKEKLKKYYHLPYDRPCMHESVFTDKFQQNYGISTLDIAKRLMDYGFHPPTIYFPLVVKNAIMVEPTETESKDTLDDFIDVMKKIAEEAEKIPPLLKDAPHLAKTERLDEVLAARKPQLKD